jgi:hypothetical protein
MRCEGTIESFTDDYTIYFKLEKHFQVKEHHSTHNFEKEYADITNRRFVK